MVTGLVMTELDLSLRPRLRGVLHQWGAVVALVAGVVAVAVAPAGVARSATAIYVASVVALLTVSAIYHRIPWRNPRARARMRRVDHAMIFVLIAGTYTPFAAVVLDGAMSTILLATVWGGAIAGIVVSILWIGAPRAITAGLYLAVGWAGVVAFPRLAEEMGPGPIALLAAGGALYTAGAVIYARKRPDPAPLTFGYHEIFHTLVLAALTLHFAAVAVAVLPPEG